MGLGLTLKLFPWRKRIQRKRKTEDQAEESRGCPLPKVLSCRYIPPDKWPHHFWLISNLRSLYWSSHHISNPLEVNLWALCIVLILKVSADRSTFYIKLADADWNWGNLLFMWKPCWMLSKINVDFAITELVSLPYITCINNTTSYYSKHAVPVELFWNIYWQMQKQTFNKTLVE